MDDEADELEAELNRLQPAAPSRRLWTSIESELGTMQVRRHRSKVIGLWVGALSAAAVIGLLVRQFGPVSAPLGNSVIAMSPSTTAPMADAHEMNFKPVAAETVLVSARDEGLITLADGTPARRERLHYVDTITWQNPRTNASLRWSIPREEVRVIPIAFQ
jgi:hypothetical protein